MIIGFATSCMNRRWQLEETLARNLEVLAGTPHFLALCDYNSADDVGRLVQDGLLDHVRRGTLLYFRTTEPSHFHMSVAKNAAHRLALRRAPDVLFNLDGDNWVTRETIALCEETFVDRDAVLHNWDRHTHHGTCGRVALAAARWRELGGYDEELLGIGWQDMDLLNRARAMGLRYRHSMAGIIKPVPNSFDDKLVNAHLPDTLLGAGGLAAFNRVAIDNMITSLGRPVRQSFEAQRRFSGVLNFSEEVIV